MKYRKKPVIVEAIQWTGDNLIEVIDFTGRHESSHSWTWEQYERVVKTSGLKIFTKEGPLLAAVGDYIVQGYSEELGKHFWPVKPDYFQGAYEVEIDPPFTNGAKPIESGYKYAQSQKDPTKEDVINSLEKPFSEFDKLRDDAHGR